MIKTVVYDTKYIIIFYVSLLIQNLNYITNWHDYLYIFYSNSQCL